MSSANYATTTDRCNSLRSLHPTHFRKSGGGSSYASLVKTELLAQAFSLIEKSNTTQALEMVIRGDQLRLVPARRGINNRIGK